MWRLLFGRFYLKSIYMLSLIIALVTRHVIALPVLTSWSRGKYITHPPNVNPPFLPNSEGFSLSYWRDPVDTSSKGEGSRISHVVGSIKRKRAPPTPSSSDVEISVIDKSPVAIRSPARKRVSHGKGDLFCIYDISIVDLFTMVEY